MSQLEEHQLEAQRAAGLREPKMNVCYVLRLGADEQGAHKYDVGSSCNWMNRLHNKCYAIIRMKITLMLL